MAQEFAGAERLAVSEQGLRRALHARGLLASVDAGRQMVLVRRTLEGAPRQVLHLKASDLVDRTAEAPGAPGGGHMIELLNSILDAPGEPTDMQ